MEDVHQIAHSVLRAITRRWARRLAGLAILLAPFLAAAEPAAAPGIVTLELQPRSYPVARQALEDAIAEEGLAPPTVNRFGEMLARTAADLGHPADIYRDAEIFSFCSARTAARMAVEDRRYIALCPLTIALYTLPDRPGRVFLAYRPPAVDTPGGRLAREMLARIAARTQEGAGTP